MALASLAESLKGILLGGYKAGGAAVSKVAGMLGDKNLWVIAITVLTFFNFVTNLVASVLHADGSQFLAALESLGVTLGGSLGQVIFGLEIVLSGTGVGAFTWIKGLVAILLGVSTIYWFYRGNAWLIRAITSFDPNLVNWIHVTAIFILSVMAFHDQSQFYELFNLTQQVGGDLAANPPMDVGIGNETANQTAVGLESGDSTKDASIMVKALHFLLA